MPFISAAYWFRVDPELGMVAGPRKSGIGYVGHDGYVRVDGSRFGHTSLMAHRLIWEAVHGPIPSGLQINHINGLKHDNRIANLEIVTPSENCRHAYRTGLASNKGEKGSRHVLTDAQVRELRSKYVRYSKDANARTLGAGLGVARRAVAAALAGRTFKNVPMDGYDLVIDGSD